MDKKILDLQDKGIVITGISDEQAHFAMKNMRQSEEVNKKFEQRQKKEKDNWYLKRLGK